MTSIRYSIEQCAVVVLAAGKSSRLGSPKQLLTYKGRSLLLHSVEVAMETPMRPVVVVTGAYCGAIRNHLAGVNVELVHNELWQEGIASSIRCGLAAVREISPATDGVVFMVCDQPYVSASLLDSLLCAQIETGLPIAASLYNDSLGTPALFHKFFFVEVMDLKGDTGAKKLIGQHKELVASVPFPEGIIDIDTGTDYESLPQ